MEFGADQAVAVLAGMRAPVFAHHLEGLFGDGAHRLDVFFELQVEHRAHVQAAFGCVRVHGAAGAVFGKDGVEPFGVVGQVRQRHCAILDKGDRLALLLHRHHDVEAGGAEIGDAGLKCGLRYLDHAAPFALRLVPAEAEIAHQLTELLQTLQVFGLILLGEFHDQHRIGVAAHGGANDRLEHRDVAAECDHGAVDQFYGNRAQLHQMLRRIHRLVEAAEMANAQHLVADDGPELEFDLCGEGQCAFGADQQMRHVIRSIARHQRIDVVAADAALHLWKPLGDLACLAFPEIEHVAEQREPAFGRVDLRQVARHFAEMQQRAVGQCRIHRQRVVAHGAVAQRTSAAGVIAGHAADGGAGGGGNVDRKPQPVFSKLAVEVVEHDAGFDHAGPVGDIEREEVVQMLRKIDDDPLIDGLAALRSAAAAGGDDSALVPDDGECPQRLVHGPGHHHAGGQDLVKGGVGRIAAAVEGIEENVAFDLAGETRGKAAAFSRISRFFGP